MKRVVYSLNLLFLFTLLGLWATAQIGTKTETAPHPLGLRHLCPKWLGDNRRLPP